jgi:hypothetical protein
VAGRRVRCWSPGTPGWARRAARVRSSVEALTDDAGAPPDVTVRLTTLALTAIADAAVGARLSGCPTTRRRPVTGRPSPPSSGTPDSGTWHGRWCCAATPVSHRARRAGPGSPAPRRSGRGPPVAGRGGPGEGGGRVRAQQRVRAGALPPALRRDPAGGRPARGGGRRGTRRPGDGRCDGVVGGPGDARVLESLGEARAKARRGRPNGGRRGSGRGGRVGLPRRRGREGRARRAVASVVTAAAIARLRRCAHRTGQGSFFVQAVGAGHAPPGTPPHGTRHIHVKPKSSLLDSSAAILGRPRRTALSE